MIPISSFNVLLIVGVLLIMYSVIDHKNRLYANIPASFLSMLSFAFLGYAIESNAVYEVIAGVVTPVNSPSIADFLRLIALIMFAYTAFMVYEVIDEQFQKKAMLAKQQEMMTEEEQ